MAGVSLNPNALFKFNKKFDINLLSGSKPMIMKGQGVVAVSPAFVSFQQDQPSNTRGQKRPAGNKKRLN